MAALRRRFPGCEITYAGNDAMLSLCRKHGQLVRMLVAVNPNHTSHARKEIQRCADKGAVGIKLAASRRCDDPLLDP